MITKIKINLKNNNKKDIAVQNFRGFVKNEAHFR